MKKILTTAILASLLLPAQLIAQKVYKSSGRVILDLTVSAGMPAGAITNVAKYKSFTPSASVLGTNNKENGSINATVFQKLEVAPNDINTTGAMNETGVGTLTMDWVTAFNACKKSTYNGGGWRLPTQRELMLIYIFRPALEVLFSGANTKLVDDHYWSATENTGDKAHYLVFGDGANAFGFKSSSTAKTKTYRVRCVREIQ